MDTNRDKGKDRYTVPEAAALLRITQDAVRKRIHRDTIEHTRDAEGRVYVFLDESELDHDTDRDTNQDALLKAYREQVEILKDQLDHERSANRENRRIIAGLTQRIPELEAATPPAEPQPKKGSGPKGENSPSDRQPRPWWRRIFGS